MLKHLSCTICNHLITNRIIPRQQVEIYQYGFELLISSLLTLCSILLLSCCFRSLHYGLLYLVLSIPLRVSVGGYHASTYTRCYFISNLCFLSCFSASKLITACKLSPAIWISLLLGSFLFITCNAPIRNRNHPISYRILKKNKRFSVCFLTLCTIIIILLYSRMTQSELLNFSVLTILSVALLMLPSLQERGKEHDLC